VTERSFDALDRPEEIRRDPEGKNETTRVRYDSRGNPGEVVDARGRVHLSFFDGLGLPTEVVEDATGKNVRIGREYDRNGRMTALVDANGNRTRYTHNARDLVVAVVRADGSAQGIEYDVRDLPVRTVDANGTVVETEYDNVHEQPMVRRIRPGAGVGGPTLETWKREITYGTPYEAHSSSDEPGGFRCDNQALIDLLANPTLDQVSIPGKATLATHGTWDGAGNPRTRRYESRDGLGSLGPAVRLALTPDGANRMADLVDEAAGLVAHWDYTGGVATHRSAGNGTTMDALLDDLGRPTAIEHRRAGSLLAGLEYAYRPGGDKEFEKRSGLIALGAFAAGVEPAGGVADVYRHDTLS
ncbi:MAG: hypothetical protein AAB297_01785, partial [Acidobacteriota bacterium]